jgi:fused signal recognition particle receptor
MSWLQNLKNSLGKSSAKISDGVREIFVKKKLDGQTLEELEELLISADLGAETALLITSELAKQKFEREVSPEEIRRELAKIIAKIIEPCIKQENEVPGTKVILVCGVNGNGKTTTIGKLANFYKGQGKSVMMAACDTFRAAAVEQLQVWADRNACELIKGPANSDPASVAFKAVEKANAENIDILLIDTAGRLHNKDNLMQELSKIERVIKKIDINAPHDSFLVLDATTGQNAHAQLESFKKAINITGIVVTKLDGTAKAGVVVALAKGHSVPIYAIGIGEGIDDLRPFKAEGFAKNLVGL